MSNIIFNDKDEPMIRISEDGLPAGTALVPAPLLKAKERIIEVNRAKCSLARLGFYITSQKKIVNKAFDKTGAKTTTEIKYRTCKTKDEAEEVGAQILECAELQEKGVNRGQIHRTDQRVQKRRGIGQSYRKRRVGEAGQDA